MMGDRTDDHGLIVSCERTPEWLSAYSDEQVLRLVDDNRRLRLRAHDAEMMIDGQRNLAKQLLAEIDACHLMIGRLWLRQLPSWSGESWTEPDEAPEREENGHESIPHLTWRETSHLLRALSKIGWLGELPSTAFTPGGIREMFEVET